MAFCGKCGKEIDDEAKFCRYCGNKVEMINNAPISNAKSMLKEIDTEASKAENKEADNNPNASLMSENGIAVKKKRSKAPLIITVIVVILAGLFVAFWFLLKPILFKDDTIVKKNLFNDGLLSAISEKGGQWGYINTKGEFVITPQFDAVTEFSDGYASVSVGGKWGIIDSSGSYVVSPQYGYISRFSKGVAVVVNFDVDDDGNDKYGLIDTKGKLLLPITYDEIGSSNFDELNSDGLNFDDDIDIFRIESNEKYGYANTKGEIIVNPTYDSAGSFSEGYADVCNNEKYGFIDQKGKLVIPCQYDKTLSFKENVCGVCVGEKWGVINKKGKYIANPKYDSMSSYSEGYAAIKKDDKWGYIDTKGKEVIKTKYVDAYSFINGKAVVEDSKNKLGIINTNDKWLKTIKYDIYPIHPRLSEDIYSIEKDGLCGMMNSQGKELVKPTYDNIQPSSYYDKRFVFSYGGKKGYLNENGDVCIGNKYIDCSVFYSDKYAIAYNDNKTMSIIDSAGDTLNDKEYYGLCGKKIDYCQYDNCFNKTRTSDSDFLGITQPEKYCGQDIARSMLYDINNEISDMAVDGESTSDGIIKIIDCSDTNNMDRISKCAADSCRGNATKGYALVVYVPSIDEVCVFWGHDKDKDLNVGAYSSKSGSIQSSFEGLSLQSIYNWISAEYF